MSHLTHQRATSRRQAMLALGRVLYAVRLDGEIKIGCTANLDNRLHNLRCINQASRVELLACLPGTFEQERAIHHRLKQHRSHGVEYYRPTAEVMAVVNDMRAGFGLAPINQS